MGHTIHRDPDTQVKAAVKCDPLAVKGVWTLQETTALLVVVLPCDLLKANLLI